MENIHPFPRMELDEHIVQSFEMDGPFPRPEGEVDILLGCADSLRFLKKRHIFLKKNFALLSTVYGYVPCGSQPAMALANPSKVDTPPSFTYLTSTKLRKLSQNPEHRHAYREAMEEYIRSQVVERVRDPAAAGLSRTDVYYLPHRAVYDASRVSTKCRIIFDASAKSPNKKSLNDNLVCGPPLQLNILAIELRF